MPLKDYNLYPVTYEYIKTKIKVSLKEFKYIEGLDEVIFRISNFKE